MAHLYPDSGDKERVRDAADIVRVVGEVLALKPKGREFSALCPFHDDHRPSLNVIPSKQIFHCFVCGTGGDVFSFVQRFHKMEFREALEFLAEKFGVPLTRRPAPADADALSRADLLAVNQEACLFYRAVLAHEEHGRAARDLLERRAIRPDLVDQFQIGAAPQRWDGLILRARQKGIPERALLELGLIKPRESGSGAYDALRHRLVFPIHDQTGRVIAFGGRRLDDADEPKYLNSPDTRLFDKSRTLYALHLASRAIQGARTAIITEGYTDAIACHQGGFQNAVATLGTALTKDHAAILRRMCDTVVLLFDGDDAGQRAADRAAEVFFAEPLDVKICTLARFTDAKDPDELLKREDGEAIFRRALGAASDLLDYRFARLHDRLRGAGLAAVARAIDDEVARLVELGLREVPPVRQALIVRRLASLARVDEATIRRAIPAGRAAKPTAPTPLPNPHADDLAALRAAGLGAREHLLACLLVDGELWSAMGEHERDLVRPSAYRSELVRELAQAVLDAVHAGMPPGLDTVLHRIDDLPTKDAAIALHERLHAETQGSRDRLVAHFRECLRKAALDRAADAPASSIYERIELKRQAHASLGGHLGTLPRPPG